MKKKTCLLRACRQRGNAQIIMAGMLALCLLAACAGPAGASTGSGGATTATSPGKHSRSWPDLNPVDWAKAAAGYMCDGATSLGGCTPTVIKITLRVTWSFIRRSAARSLLTPASSLVLAWRF